MDTVALPRDNRDSTKTSGSRADGVALWGIIMKNSENYGKLCGLEEDAMREPIPLQTAKPVTQADGRTILVDAAKCLGAGQYPCPGCSNCDRFVPWVDEMES